MRIEDGADSGADSGFLMELMEINEALDGAQSSEEADKIGQDTKGEEIGMDCSERQICRRQSRDDQCHCMLIMGSSF